MRKPSPYRTAAKIAWRETRASSGRFIFVILAVAAGVGSLTGVRGFSRAFHTMLQRDARTFMAADLTVRHLPTADAAQTADNGRARRSAASSARSHRNAHHGLAAERRRAAADFRESRRSGGLSVLRRP